MESIRTALANVADMETLDAQMQPSALQRLFDTYNLYASKNAELPRIHLSSTGAEFKTALEQLSEAEQSALVLLYQVAQPLPSSACIEDPKVRDERRLKHWTIKFGLSFAAAIGCLITGAVVVIGVKSGAMPEGTIVNTIMTTATEIIKVIFAAT